MAFVNTNEFRPIRYSTFSQLCILLNAEVIYRIFAEIIFEETTNLKFASTMVRTLNTILFTTSELFELRMHLKDITNEVMRNGFHLDIKCELKYKIYSFFIDFRNQLPYSSASICLGLIVPFQHCHCVY